MRWSRKKPPEASPDEQASASEQSRDQDSAREPMGAVGPRWAGRGLRLPAPPDAAHAPELAAWFVDGVQKLWEIRLDYSVESLEWVDSKLGSFSSEGSDVVAETIFAAGCYVGEVLVRQHAYSWTDFDEKVSGMFGFPVGVVGPDGNHSNPIGKAFKRVNNGPLDDLRYFVHMVTSQS
ncbi:MAG: hypothetical protein ACHP7F_06175 [Actinomycetales bacterium]|jgi:hypothetical protein|nr:hypothetical protein [Leifsonia sp.]